MHLSYKGYRDLPVFNFYEILETNNLSWFKKNYDGEDDELSKEETEELIKRFHKIYEDRISYLGDANTEQYFRKLAEINSLEQKIYRVSNTCKIITQIPLKSKWFNKFIQDLKEEGIKFGKPIKTEEERLIYFKFLESKLRGERNRLKVKKIQYKDILEPKKKVKIDLVKDKVIIEEILAPKSINLRTTPLQEWDVICKRAEQKSKPKG